jgi:hypothetical protein
MYPGSKQAMEGKCICGAVSITANDATDVSVCHCGMCRRWGGGPLLAIHCGADVEIAGADDVTVFNSSDWAERGFCKGCGTHLFYRLKANNEYFIPAGLFQDQADFKIKGQIFIDKKPSYYEFANETPALTEEEVFELYAPK